jgi:hypothetical protein
MGLIVSPGKIQKQSPFHIWDSLLLRDRLGNLKTLNDFQTLLGDRNWLCPAL